MGMHNAIKMISTNLFAGQELKADAHNGKSISAKIDMGRGDAYLYIDNEEVKRGTTLDVAVLFFSMIKETPIDDLLIN